MCGVGGIAYYSFIYAIQLIAPTNKQLNYTDMNIIRKFYDIDLSDSGGIKTKGAKKCAEWLSYCLSIGWPKSQLDELEKLWWKYHDENGNIKSTPEPEMDNKPVNNSPIQQINERYNLPNSKLAQKINEYFRTHTPEQIYEAFEAAREQRISAPLSEGDGKYTRADMRKAIIFGSKMMYKDGVPPNANEQDDFIDLIKQ